jgi:hypothetical protein
MPWKLATHILQYWRFEWHLKSHEHQSYYYKPTTHSACLFSPFYILSPPGIGGGKYKSSLFSVGRVWCCGIRSILAVAELAGKINGFGSIKLIMESLVQ